VTGSPDGPDGPRRGDPHHLLDEAARFIDALGGLPQSPAGAECRICPFCRLLATLRELRPEVVEHLALAADELLAAVREFAARPPAPGPGPGPGEPDTPDTPGVPDAPGAPRAPEAPGAAGLDGGLAGLAGVTGLGELAGLGDVDRARRPDVEPIEITD